MVVTLCSSCAQTERSGADPDQAIPDLLWAPPSATLEPDTSSGLISNGRSIYVDGSGAILFTLAGDREELAAGVVRSFEAAGWRQRKTRYLNPQHPTSFERGWESRCACVVLTDEMGTSRPREPLYQWHGEWQNSRGDIVTYNLSAEGRQLRGYGAFVPRQVVAQAVGIH